MLNNIGLVIQLLCFVVSVFGMATFRVGNQTFQYRTQDLFEVKVAPYTTRGILVDAVFNEDSLCEMLPSVLDTARFALHSVRLHNISSVIIAIDAKKAKECGCRTINHVSHPYWYVVACYNYDYN
ncbi:hypothetical protein BDF19DRAFT_227085 [Syncephalis fuscata]|nr:hypothetical protein BDF19DRAFT_227085 [Syncephalis fuscata]